MVGRSEIHATLLLVCIMIVPMLAVSGNPIVPPAPAPYGHGYGIYIDSDSDFTMENGVTAGTGTWGDPFIIQEMSINLTVTDDHGVYIHETTSHFIIRNMTIDLGRTYRESCGIELNGVRNGRVQSCEIGGSGTGVGVSYSSNVAIIQNVIAGDHLHYGLDLSSSSNLTISGNVIDGYLYGIWMNGVVDTSVNNNTVVDALGGILLVDSIGIAIADNQVDSDTDPYFDNKWAENTWPESHKVIEETSGKVLLLAAVVPAFALMSAGMLLMKRGRSKVESK